MAAEPRRRDRAFGDALLAARRRAGLTQVSVAAHLGVQRAMVSQWETGRHRPSATNVEKLGRFLDASQELVAAAAPIEPSDPAPSPTREVEAPTGLTLYDVHRGLGQKLVEALAIATDGTPLGWRRDFREDIPPTAFTTASALRLLTVIQDPPYVDRQTLGQRVLAFHLDEGGWGAGSVGRRPEATAVVIDALERIGTTFDVDAALDELGAMLIGPELRLTYVLAEALSTTARLRPASELARRLAGALLENRDSKSLAWPEKRPALKGAFSYPSTAHTARAVTVLAHALDRGLDDADRRYREAVDAGQRWLERNADLELVRENVAPVGRPDLEIRHFTPALVAHALSSVHTPPWELLVRALDEVWQYYNPVIDRWQWPNGDVAIWMQLDALRAVTAAHARLSGVPVVAMAQDET